MRIPLAGHKVCERHWWRRPTFFNDAFRIYFIVDGEGHLNVGDCATKLACGWVYFIPAYTYLSYHCDEMVEQYFFHCCPESVHLDLRLARITTVQRWPLADCVFWMPACERLTRYNDMGHDADYFSIQAMAQWFMADALRRWGPSPADDTLIDTRLQPAIDYLDSHYALHPGLAMLAPMVNMSQEHFHREFVRVVHTTPHEYLMRCLLRRAVSQLRNSDRNIAEIAERLGFSSAQYFSQVFKKHMQMTPTEFRRARALQ